MFSFSERSKRRMEGVNPKLREIAENAIGLTVVDFGVPQFGGLRTAEEQQELFVDGKSKLDGFNKLSKHQSGNALDVYAFVDGKASWDIQHLALVACAMLQSASILGYKLRWGGHWREFRDMPHFELVE